ncbi:hypothetical protein E2C01_101382 [Portunus trituberculatus]|uniref:Uncharacterized protein n=1 Tax=Portunus trituberculatus TaxID=210409 RepID=A0A5B7KEM4_PORTR|nr:hypothetical protein [Portunus trituberculatus]
MVMGRRYHYGHAKLNKLMATFIKPADFNDLYPMYHLPYILEIMKYFPFKKQAIKGIRDMHCFLKEELKEFMADEELKKGDNFTALYLKEIEKKENPNFNSKSNFSLFS